MKFLTALVATYAAVAAAAAIGQPLATNDVAVDAPFVELVTRGKTWDTARAKLGFPSERQIIEDRLKQANALPNDHPDKHYRIRYLKERLYLINFKKEVAKMPRGEDRDVKAKSLQQLTHITDHIAYPAAEVAARFRD